MANSCAPILATPSHAFYTLRNAPVCQIPCLLLAFFDAEGPSPGAAFGTLNPSPSPVSSCICQHKLSFTSQTLFCICQHKLSFSNQPLFLYLLRERGLNAGVHAECICLNTSKYVHEYLMHECTSFFLSVKSTHCTTSQNVTQPASNNRLAEFLSHFAFPNTDLLHTPCPDLWNHGSIPDKTLTLRFLLLSSTVRAPMTVADHLPELPAVFLLCGAEWSPLSPAFSPFFAPLAAAFCSLFCSWSAASFSAAWLQQRKGVISATSGPSPWHNVKQIF